MKQNYLIIICALFVMGVFQSAMAQRAVDLDVEVIAPLDGDEFFYNEVYNFKIKVANLGGVDIELTDSLKLSITMNGSPLMFGSYTPGEAEDHRVITNYEIEVGEEQVFSQLSSFADPEGNAENKEYEVCVKVIPFNASDYIEDSVLVNNEFCYTIFVKNESLGINQNDFEELKVYPNPASNQVVLDFIPDNNQLVLTSIDGKHIVVSEFVDGVVDVTNLSSGMYIMNFKINGKPYSKKIMIE